MTWAVPLALVRRFMATATTLPTVLGRIYAQQATSTLRTGVELVQARTTKHRIGAVWVSVALAALQGSNWVGASVTARIMDIIGLGEPNCFLQTRQMIEGRQ